MEHLVKALKILEDTLEKVTKTTGPVLSQKYRLDKTNGPYPVLSSWDRDGKWIEVSIFSSGETLLSRLVLHWDDKLNTFNSVSVTYVSDPKCKETLINSLRESGFSYRN